MPKRPPAPNPPPPKQHPEGLFARSRPLDRDPVDLDGDTPRSRERTDLALALDAVSADLDAQGDEIASIGGEVKALASLSIDTNDKVREILLLLSQHVMPRLDRVDEIDEVRGKAERLRVDFDRHVAKAAE